MFRALKKIRCVAIARRPSFATEGLEGRVLLAANYHVDDDRVQCPDAEFATPAGIQLALDAAAADPEQNTITVCPGQYFPVIVNPGNARDILISSNQPVTDLNQDQQQAPPTSIASDPTRHAIILGTPPNPAGFLGGVTINADNFTLNGFFIQENSAGPGVFTSATASGYLIKKNVIQDNVFGIYFNSNGVNRTFVEDNLILNNNRIGSASGNGIYEDQGLLNAEVHHNDIALHTNAASVFVGPSVLQPGGQPVQGLDYHHNRIYDDAAVTALGITNSFFHHNESYRSSGSGIVLTDANKVDVGWNKLVDGTFNGVSLTTIGVGESANVRIHDNTVSGFGDNGIRLSFATNSLVDHNEVFENRGSGILLESSADFNRIAHNKVYRNGSPLLDLTDGIRVQLGSVGNLIEENEAYQNVTHDLHDDNPPGANIWRKNKANTENRPGLAEERATNDT